MAKQSQKSKDKSTEIFKKLKNIPTYLDQEEKG